MFIHSDGRLEAVRVSLGARLKLVVAEIEEERGARVVQRVGDHLSQVTKEVISGRLLQPTDLGSLKSAPRSHVTQDF